MPFLHVREIGTCQNSELLGPGELFLRLRGPAMFRPPDIPSPQPPPEIRIKRVRIDVYAKNSDNNEEILPATWQQEQRRLGRRRWRPPAAPALRWWRPPAAPSGGAAAASPASASEEYRKQPTLPEAGMCCGFMRGWGCVADQARMEMCCGSGEDGGSSSSSWGPIMRVCSGSGEPEDYFSIQKYRQTLNRRIC